MRYRQFIMLRGGASIREDNLRHLMQCLLARVLGATAILFAVAMFPPDSDARDLVLAEPVHYVGFLPIYVAQKKGYFKDEGINLQILTMEGPAMIPSVVAGRAFALTASVDRNAQAKVGGREVKAVVDLNARANIYLMARKDLMPVSEDLPSFLRGKRIAVTLFGGTPNNMLRYLLTRWKLDPRKDVTLVEVNSQAIVAITVGANQAEVGVSAEPFISQGIRKGIWGEPIYAAKDLGSYADTAISVNGESVRSGPLLVKSLVKAVMRGLVYTNEHRSEMLEFASAEFPSASREDLEASLTRAFADQIYSTDGFITPQAWTMGEAVVRQAGILKQDVGYDDVIDMQFVRRVQQELQLKSSP
jgi:NitT/TauT family transport system substrate-binding protein